MSTKESKGKFAAQIAASTEEIKGARAEKLAKSVKRAAEDLERKLDGEVDELESKILDLSDLAPDTSYSLRPGGGDFNAKGWVNDMHEATLELELKKIELKVAQDILKEWF